MGSHKARVRPQFHILPNSFSCFLTVSHSEWQEVRTHGFYFNLHESQCVGYLRQLAVNSHSQAQLFEHLVPSGGAVWGAREFLEGGT